MDHCMVGPRILGRSIGCHRVHHKHRSDLCNVGWQMEGQHTVLHHRHDFHKGGHRRDGHHMGVYCKVDLCTAHRSGHHSADLGKDYMAGHNKDRHRGETDGLLVVFSRWIGLVYTQ